MKQHEYAIVVEKSPNSFGAYVPDLPGCAAVGRTKRETVALLRKAIVMHLKGMVEDGEKIPKPTSMADSVVVSVPVSGRTRRIASM